MSLISRVTSGLRTRAGEPRATGSLLTDSMLLRSLSAAGRMVTNQNVTGISAVWAAVWLIADQAGSLPLRIYRREGDELEPAGPNFVGGWVRQPNPETSAIDLWTVVICHLELWGNAFLGKERVAGRVVHLWPIPPERVTPRRERGQKVFDVIEDDGSVHTYTTRDVLHIRHRSLDGFMGASPIHVHRNTMGVALALDDFAGDTFRNRAVPAGVLSVKGRITDPDVREEMRGEWEDRYGRRGKRGQIAILDDEAKFTAVSMPLIDAQFIEQRKHSVQDIARIFGISPEDIGGDSGGSMTYSNVQARRADLLQFVLWSRLKRIEGALLGDRDLFKRTDGLEPHFDDTDFLRGDPREQYETLRVATGNKPVLTQDEARRMVGKGTIGGTAAELDHKSAIGNVAGGQPSQEA